MAKTVSSPDLVGRTAELSILVDAFEKARTGEPRCVMVGGEAGVGKSRLLDTLVKQVSGDGARVLVGSCVELAGGHLPFAPVVQALRGFVRTTDPKAAADLIGTAGEELARFFPELGHYEATEAPSSGYLTLDSSQGRLFEAVLNVLEKLAEPDGVVLVFEDLHWADDSTRDLVSFIVRNLRNERLLLVGTYRSDELHRQHPLRPFLASLDADRVDRIQLERFGRNEVRAQLAGILGSDPDPALVEGVFDRSEGNPFFTEELLAARTSDLAFELPNTLRDALMVRVEVLSPQAQQVVRVASVAGRHVDHELLAGVMDLDEDQLIVALREAVSRHLLETGRADNSYAFRHALVREAIYEDLLPGERTRLHSNYAQVLGQKPELAGGTGAAASAELAYHSFAAHDLDAAFSASVEAGQASLEGFAFAESVRHFERALELWDQVPAAVARMDVDRLDMYRKSGDAAYLRGDVDRASGLFRAALEMVDHEADPITAAVLHERISRCLRAEGHGEAALIECRRAVELLPSDPPSPELARVLATEGQLLLVSGRYSEARTVCERAIEIARLAGARAAEGHAMNTLGGAIAELGDPDRGIEHLRRSAAIAQEVRSVDDIGRAYPNLETAMCVAGRFEEAAQVCRDGIAVTKEFGLERFMGAWLKVDLGYILVRLGEWAEAHQVLDGIGGTGMKVVRAAMHTGKAELAVRRGSFEAASNELSRAAEFATGDVDPQFQGPYYGAIAELALWQGRPVDAAAAVREGLDRIEGTEEIAEVAQLYWHGIRAAADQADALTKGEQEALEAIRLNSSGMRDQAVGVLKRAEAEGKAFALGISAATSAEAEWSRVAGTPDADLWSRAAERWKEIQHPFELAYARWREAEAALSSGNKKRAESALQEAFEIATRLGARPLLEEVEGLARRARMKTTQVEAVPETAVAPGSPADGLGLTPREVEVLRLVVEGLTNPQIATELFISEKTASVHVSHILAKLGVASRTEAATVAHRLGL